MSKEILEKDLISLMGIDELSPERRDVFLDDIGSLIMENAIGRLTFGMDDAASQEFEQVVTNANTAEKILEALGSHYPEFETLLTEEMVAFKQEAVSVLQD